MKKSEVDMKDKRWIMEKEVGWRGDVQLVLNLGFIQGMRWLHLPCHLMYLIYLEGKLKRSWHSFTLGITLHSHT